MKNRNISTIFYTLIVIIAILGTLAVVLAIVKEPSVKNINITTNYERDTSFSEIEFVHYIEQLNVKYPEIVYAQAKLESGNFNSPLFKLNNNLFGMGVIKNRPTTSLGARYGFAYFNTWKDSVLDYVIYQCLYLKDKSYQEYLHYLDTTYAEDEENVNKITKIAEEYKLLK